MQRLWIDLDGLANLRDVGGIPTDDGGEIAPGRLLRSDNLQSLSDGAVDALLDMGVSDVVDLRSDYEADREGPGPLSRTGVRHHRFSLFREWRGGVGQPKDAEPAEVLPAEALPWVDLEPQVTLRDDVASHYISYVLDRPDSILGALRVIARAEGATLVHCAAGKDRTGTVIALALSVAGAHRQAIVDDYAASSERIHGILDRLRVSDTYADNLRGRPLSSHLSHPETMETFLGHLDAAYGGVPGLLTRLGWSEDDNAQLRDKLLD